jgi:H+-transporting ATPase
MVALIGSIVLLELSLDSQSPDGLWRSMGLPVMTYGEIQTLMYLKISLSDYFSVFNSRTKGWMWSRMPSIVLFGAFILATTCSTFLAVYWPFGNGMQGIEWDLAVYCWLYVIMWAFIQDAAKVVTYKVLQSIGWVESVKVIDEKALKRGRDAVLGAL